MKIYARITKVDTVNKTVYGRAVQEEVDRSKEIFDYETSKPLFVEWSEGMAKITDGKSVGNVRAMHGKVAAGKLSEMICNDAEKAIDIAAIIVDANELKKCEEGVYTGFSIGGSYAKKWPDDANPSHMRYTAKPTEISLVDLPCGPSATFSVIKADGSSELRKFVLNKAAQDHKDKQDFHEEMAQKHKKAGAQAEKDGDGDKADDHEAAADAHEAAGKAHGEAAEGEGSAADANKKSRKAAKATKAAGGDPAPAPAPDNDDAEKLAVAALAKLFNEGALKPSEVLAKVQANKGDMLRKALDNAELTNGDLDKLAKAYMPATEYAEAAGNTVKLITGLEKLATTKVLTPQQELSVALNGNPTGAAVDALCAKYFTAEDNTLAKDYDEGMKLTLLRKVAERADVNPKEGTSTYGDVEFADEKNKKYPIDKEAHIKAAWNYINKRKNAAKYDAADVSAIKKKIVAAWKSKIDKDGPPSAEKFVKGLGLEQPLAKAYMMGDNGQTMWITTGLSAVSNFAYTVQSLWDAARASCLEQEYEGDTTSNVPKMLEALAAQAGEILCHMVEEEVSEENMTAEKAALTGELRKRYTDDAKSDSLLDLLLAKAGARHSKEDLKRLQNIHDHSVDMGATCSSEEAEKLLSGDALRKAMGLEESADNAVLLATFETLRKKAKAWDDAPAMPRGVLKAVVVTKEGDALTGSGGTAIPEEMQKLMSDAEKGDPVAQMRLVHTFGASATPIDPARQR